MQSQLGTTDPIQADRRLQIVLAAEQAYARNGLIGTSMAEIAQAAEVRESVIYQYFKGKEDLLFAIPEMRMPEVLQSLELSLQGIRDQPSLVSRFIWFQLQLSKEQPNIPRILIFECRSSKEWYQSPAYRLVRRYAGILTDILASGVKHGRFRSDLDLKLARDVIFGMMDYTYVAFLLTNEIDDPIRDLDGIMDLILPMIEPRSSGKNDTLNKYDRILLAAEQVMADEGFTKAKISTIARESAVSDGTVYEYFKSKEDLLLSIPAKRLRDHMERLSETFEMRTPLKRLQHLIRMHFSLYLTKRNFLKIFLLHVHLNPGFYQSSGFEAFKQYYDVIEAIIREGQQDGTFREDVEPRIFRYLFLGAFNHLTIRWFIIDEGEKTDVMQEIDQITDMLCRAVLTDEALAALEIENR